MAKQLVTLTLLSLFFQPMGQAQDAAALVAATVEASEVLRKKEDTFAAINILEPVLERLENEGHHDALTLVPLYHKLGVNYYRRGNHLKAEQYTNKALLAREAAYGKVHIDVARGYYLRAILNKELQQYGQAQEDLEQATSSMEMLLKTAASTDTLRLIWMFEERIRLHSALRNNTLALQFWNKTYDYYAQNEAAYFADIIDLYKNKGHIHYNQQKFDLSEQAYQKAIQLFDRYGQPPTLLKSIASIYSDLGVIQFKQGKLEAASLSYQTSKKYLEQLLKDNESPWLQQKLGIVYANMLELAGKTGDDAAVDKYFELALENYMVGCGTFYHMLIATLYQNMVEISLAKGELEEALRFNQQSLHALLPDFKSDDPLQPVDLNRFAVKDKLSFLETLRQKSAILMAIHTQQSGSSDAIQAAFQNYQTLDTVITQIRQSYNATGSQFELIEQSYPIYEQAIQTALLLYQQSKETHYLEVAYHYAAKNKALVLLGSIQEEQAKTFSSIPESLRVEERELKKSIFQLESALYDLGDQGSNLAMKDSLFTLQRDYQKLINRFEENYPDYYASKYGFDKSIKTADLQQRLDQQTAIIEYFVGEKQIFVFLLTKTDFDYVAMDKPDNFDSSTRSFRAQIQSQLNITDDFLQQSHQLYQWLLAKPLSNPIVERVNHLIIIPDGVLLQLPFDALVQDRGNVPNYLLRDYAISYAYSNRLLFKPMKAQPAPKIFAGYGLEYDDYTLAGLAAYVDAPLAGLPVSRALGKLQYSDDEVQEIATLLSGDQWTNETATRQSFLETADRYAILHMAMHGILNEEYPMNSALIFSRPNDTTDYFLRAADIYNMQLNADMVVLSACNTAAGTLQKGEGVRSLARAFSFAGCPSLIASLWNATDKSTKDILLDFYKNLKQGMPKDQAMRQAKLAYLDNTPPAYQSPYYWSHLSVIGDRSELKVLAPSFLVANWHWGALLLIVLLGLWLYARRSNL